MYKFGACYHACRTTPRSRERRLRAEVEDHRRLSRNAGVACELKRFYCKHVMLTELSAKANKPSDAKSSDASSAADDADATALDASAAADMSGAFDDDAERELLRKPSERAITVTLPPEAQMQCWRSGVYLRVDKDDSKASEP